MNNQDKSARDMLQQALQDLHVHQIELEMQNEELRQTQLELEASRARYFDLYDLAPVGYCTLSEQGLILQANLKTASLLGINRDQLTKRPLTRFILKEDQGVFYLQRKQLAATGQDQSGELRMIRHGSTLFWTNIVISTAQESDGTPVLRVILTDINIRKAVTDEIEQLAFYDQLTALPNRRLLRDRIKQALEVSTRGDTTGALLFLDLDNFKTLNDTLGHDTGDVLLQQVANRLITCVRKGDTVARLGGDEFVVMLEDLDTQALGAAAQTEAVGEKILTCLNQPFQLGAHTVYSTPSIGAALFHKHSPPIDGLLKQTDIAMYQAKKAGGNTLRFFDPKMQASINARAALETDIRGALAKNQFKLYYQIQITQDGQAAGAEVLLRWQHPKRGLVSPLEFIPLAEESGLILPIGQWVLHSACAQLQAWQDSPQLGQISLAVNVSARQFYQANFVEQVISLLKQTGTDPGKLKLELTESLLLDDINDAIAKMNTLKALGVDFSVDDFGTGFSSLAYLTRLPLSQLKIDQSFIHNLGHKHADDVIVQTIIGMAKNLEMTVVAEGVETEEQLVFLEQHGCTQCQGYLFSKPVPLAEFEALYDLKYVVH